ncbi:MAG: 50S ribosomal protein L30 [Gemmatimonadota bacterium]
MGRLPPTRKYRKRKTGRDPVLPPVGKGKLRIKQVRSGSGHSYRMKRTLEALGLKHHQAEVVHADHPALRGMLQQVRHLVEVTPDKEGKK